jgi:hypothetical protein
MLPIGTRLALLPTHSALKAAARSFRLGEQVGAAVLIDVSALGAKQVAQRTIASTSLISNSLIDSIGISVASGVDCPAFFVPRAGFANRRNTPAAGFFCALATHFRHGVSSSILSHDPFRGVVPGRRECASLCAREATAAGTNSSRSFLSLTESHSQRRPLLRVASTTKQPKVQCC